MMFLFPLEHNHSYLWFFLKRKLTAWFSNNCTFKWANVSEKGKEQGQKKEEENNQVRRNVDATILDSSSIFMLHHQMILSA